MPNDRRAQVPSDRSSHRDRRYAAAQCGRGPRQLPDGSRFYAGATAVGGGFASAFVATGSLRAGHWGALSAAVFWGIRTGFSKTRTVGTEQSLSPGTAVKTIREAGGSSLAKVAAHAAAGGTLNTLQGGKFGHGFLSAGVTEALSPAIGAASSGGGAGGVVAGTVASAVVGGTVSELSGGKFGNGAQTGAFQFLFNATVHAATTSGDSGRISEEGTSFATETSRTWGSYVPGTYAGDGAAEYWAARHVGTGNPLYAVPGLLASLWTPDTAASTAFTLGTAGGASVLRQAAGPLKQ